MNLLTRIRSYMDKRRHQTLYSICVFITIWFGFGSSFLLRKPFGIIKSNVADTFNVTEDLLGYMDVTFTVPYSLVSIIFGSLGDKVAPGFILGGGLIGSGLATLAMGFICNYWEFLAFIFVSGTLQSLSWPSSCSLISSLFSENKKTIVFSVFSASGLIGSVCGSVLTVYLENKFGWKDVFLPPAIIASCFGIIIIIFAIITFTPPTQSNENLKKEESFGLSPWKSFRLPVIPELSLALFFIKAGRNAALFWLPYFLSKVLGYTNSEAGLAAISAELGGMVGSIAVGVITDKFLSGKDALVSVFTSFGCSVVMLALIFTEGLSKITHIGLMILAGAFLTSSEFIIGGSLPSKFGKRHNAESSVLGVINGIGSLGGIVEGLVIAYTSELIGVQSVAYLMSGFCALASLISVRIHILSNGCQQTTIDKGQNQKISPKEKKDVT